MRMFVRSFMADLDANYPRSQGPRRYVRAVLDPGVAALAVMRVELTLWHHGARLPAWLVRLLLVRWFGMDVLPGAQIGPGLIVRHPAGIVIGQWAVVGRNVTVAQGVTLGQRSLRPGASSECPTIGDGVILGAGAGVFGPISVGDGAVVGANAVVLASVPAGSTVVGAPAQPVGRARVQ